MDTLTDTLPQIAATLFIAFQILYTCGFLVDLYLFTRPVNWVDVKKAKKIPQKDYPYIVLFYPVLRELEETMRTTFRSLVELDYPKDKYRIVAIPNANDHETVARLYRLQQEFPVLDITEVPPTTDPSWQVVWDAWERNPKTYWWHAGDKARIRELPPKKTRQLVYALYHMMEEMRGKGDFAVNYIDADSCPPRDHFLAAAAGLQDYDVLQALNVAGNLNSTMAATLHSFDHMAWDGKKYPHLSANGHHPYWMLGKGLFYKGSDLEALGGFNPWIAIEDPEVGMRFWANGKKLGIIENPLVEEVPETIMGGITQRKRWVCGFFQSLGEPLTHLGLSPLQKFQAWCNFLPCLLLSLNIVGAPTGIWALWAYFEGSDVIPLWAIWLAVVNLCALAFSMVSLYVSTWKRTRLVLHTRRERIWYMLRVNPITIMVWWVIWLIPLWIGFRMYMRDGGLVWDRTKKIDANHYFILSKIERSRSDVFSKQK